MRIVIIGIGGIGCHLLPVLCRYLRFHTATASTNTEVALVDGDMFEPKNEERQAFKIIGNKAEVTAQSLSADFPGLTISAVLEYFDEVNAVRLIREGNIVFLCVDNHVTRKMVSDRCCELNDVVLISGGNEYTDGNVQIYIRKDGEDLTLPIANEFHPEIEEPEDRHPGQIGCGELIASKPQLIFINNAIASAMLAAFYAWQAGKISYDEVYIDLLSGNNRSVKRS